jgi:hypothetical protein
MDTIIQRNNVVHGAGVCRILLENFFMRRDRNFPQEIHTWERLELPYSPSN